MAHQVGVMRVALGITPQSPLIVVSRGYLCVVGINRRASEWMGAAAGGWDGRTEKGTANDRTAGVHAAA